MKKTVDHSSEESLPESGQENNEMATRRQAISLAAAGITGLLVSQIAGAQQATVSKSEISMSPVLNRSGGTIPLQRSSVKLLKDDAIPVSFKRGVNEDTEWKNISDQIDSLLALTSNQTVSGTMLSQFVRIEKGFSFSSRPLDDEFLITHIEPLIDQAADLLDRCLKDRSNWDELAVKMFNLAVELKEYKELDKIHLEEEAAGIYDYPYRQSLAEYNAELINQEKSNYNKSSLDWIISSKFSSENINKLSAAQQLSSFLAGMVPYAWKSQEFSDYWSVKWSGVEKKVYQHHQDAATTQSFHNLFLQRDLLEVQKRNFENQAQGAGKKLDGLKAKADWDRNNKDFLRRRTLVSRNLQDIRAKASTTEDGILNYSKRLVPLKQRFDSDFRDALARMKVVEKGLKEIYGFDFPLPRTEGTVGYYDDCLLWSRSVIQWILKFTRKELNTIYPISLRAILGDDVFKSMRNRGKWIVDLNEHHFPAMSAIRLRGISISLQDNLTFKERIWQFMVTPPKSGQIRHLNTGSLHTIDQSFLDPSIFGRVTERSSDKAPDIIGITSLYNASPIGKWEINVHGSIPQRIPRKIDDIQIDFHLAYKFQSSTFKV